MKKIILFVMVLLLAAWGMGAAYSGGGTGSAETPYTLISKADWDLLAATEADQASGVYVQLGSNIDFEGASCTMISSPSFQFDGKNYSLKNGTITGTTAHTSIFQDTGDDFDVKDLKVEGFTVTGASPAGSPSYVAVIADELATASIIDNCDVINCTVSTTHTRASYYCIVGLVAGSAHGNVTNCTSSGTAKADITAGTYLSLGGLVGQHSSPTSGVGKIENCTSTATVTHVVSGTSVTTPCFIGGIVGQFQDGTGAGIDALNNCQWSGIITYTADSSPLKVGGVAGVIGSQAGCNADNCSATGSITVVSTGQCFIGGAFGDYQGGTIDSCYSNTAIFCNVASSSPVGSFAGRLYGFLPSGAATLTVTNCYSTGTIYDTSNNQTSLSFQFGGFTGWVNKGTALSIDRCFTTVKGYPDTTYSGDTAAIGGFTSLSALSPTYSDCFWDTTVSGLADGLGQGGESGEVVSKTTTELKTQSTFTDLTYDFAGVGQAWKMLAAYEANTATDTKCSYPLLLWQTYSYSGGAGTSSSPYKIKTTLDWNWAYGNIDVRSGEITTYFQLMRDSTLSSEFMIIKKGSDSRSTPYGNGSPFGN